jgi:ATP-dependent helicase/DNAse subunit B
VRIITGPLGSGKTTALLADFRASVLDGATLLVPTATMAEHVRNSLIRSGLVFSPSAVTTLAKFAAAVVPEAKVVSTAALEVLAESALNATRLYGSVADFAGFRRALVGCIEELSAAGITPADLEACEFATIYADVAAEVHRRGWLFGIERLRSAAEAIGHMPGKIFLDGFYSFTPGELAVVKALASRTDVTVTMPLWSGSQRTLTELKRSGFNETSLDNRPAEPARRIIDARTIHDEVNAIAAQIAHVHASGTPYRDIAVIVRNETQYGAALRGTFERFGIPARFYFATPLRLHPSVRFLSGLVDLVLSDWDNQIAADVLRLSDSMLEAAGYGDGFEAKLRAGEWSKGFESIKAALPERGPYRKDLGALEELRSIELDANDWVQRLAALSSLLAMPDIRDGVPHQEAIRWRERGQALVAYQHALEAAAEIAGTSSRMPLQKFWRIVGTVIENADLRVNDHRRDVVHVIDAYEARQWNLPVVFVCGLLEGQFPKHHTEDPILPDAVRRALQSRGFQVPASSDRQRDEAFLFDVAATRATSQLVLTYPRTNPKGDDNVRSFLVDHFCARHSTEPAASKRMRPTPTLQRLPTRRAEIFDESLHPLLVQGAAELGPTAIEMFLQCPFRYFVDRTLRLQPLADKPALRMTPLVQGNIVHGTIERVCNTKEHVETALEFELRRQAQKHNIPASYKLEAVRLELLHNIKKFFAENRLQMDGNTEIEFEIVLPLDSLTTLRGRIDRIEFDDRNGPAVIDLKFKTPEKLRDDIRAHKAGRLVQGGLYLFAVQQQFGETPAAMLYCSTKKQIETRGWVADGPYRGSNNDCTEADLAAVMSASLKVATDALVQIRTGKIAPDPFDQTKCDYCSALNVCRWEVQQPARIAGGAV